MTWYQPLPTPGKIKSNTENESNYEIYIGVITAIAILLVITCAFAIWVGRFKKSGYVYNHCNKLVSMSIIYNNILTLFTVGSNIAM